MKKVTILAILTLALLFFAACNNNNDNNNGEEESVTQDTVVEDPTTPDTPEPTPEPEGVPMGNIHPVRDFGGRTMVFSGHLPFSGIFDEPDPATANIYFLERLIWDNSQRLRRDFNFDIENIHLDYGDVLPVLTATSLAGDPMADMVGASASVWLPAGHTGLIHPIDTINLPNSDIQGPQLFGNMRGRGLGHFWIAGSVEPNHDGRALAVNQELIRAIGAPNPVDLYNSGQWTWDAMLEIMRLATRDTTGDGVLDQWGYSGMPGDIIVTFLIGSNDGPLVSSDFQYAFDHPNTIEAMEFANIIFRENLWQFDAELGPYGSWADYFFAFNEGRAVFTLSETWNMMSVEFDYSIVPFPLGPSNTSGNTWMGNDRHAVSFATASSWGADELLLIMEELFSWPIDDPSMVIDYGGQWARNVLPTEEDAQRQWSVANTMNSDYGMIVPEFSWIFGTFANHMVYQNMTVMQMIETYRGPQQERLDMFFGGN